MSVPRPDPDAPRRVDPSYSLWVSANAGAGKTHVLIDRIVRLLIAGTLPERILCLTFTKAAAAEMATRLSTRLGDYALMDDAQLVEALGKIHIGAPPPRLLAHTRTLFARALETPGGLKIQTIHAFCERLLGRFPVEAGVVPHFEVLDDGVRGDLLRSAQVQVLDALNEAEEALLQCLARETDGAGFSQMVQDLMRFRATGNDDPRAALFRLFALPPDASETAVRAQACARFDDALMMRCRDALMKGGKTDTDTGRKIAAFLNASDRAAALEDYADAFLTQGEPRVRLSTKAVQQDNPWLEEALRAEQRRMDETMRTLSAVRAAELAHAALVIGRRVIARYEAMKALRAALDFSDLITRAVALLERRDAAQWVLYKLDGGLDHILVDEAQDTNPEQWRVIAALAQEFFVGKGARDATRTLFVVGDRKQSIYSFQGAEPGAFARMADAFKAQVESAGRKWSDHVMAMSWRSTAPVLRLVDAVFPGTPHDVRRVDDAGLVEFWPTEKPEARETPDIWSLPVDYRSPDSPRARLARRIARQVRGWIENGEELAAQGRAIRPGDVMILVRRRNSFVDEVIRALKLLNIPVAGSDRLALTEHIAVMDLMALMRFVLLPGDDLNLAALLKSPLFGLDEDRLFTLAHHRTGTLMDALGASGDARAREMSGALTALIGDGAHMPPYTFLSHVLGPLRGRERIVSRLGDDANDPIDELLHLAHAYEQSHAPALQSFVHWLEKGQAEVKRDMEHGRNEVRVMTVHGAKGLEAPIVILPDTCAMPHVKSRPGFFALETPGGEILPVWSQRKGDAPLLDREREKQKLAAQEEHERLLYVALTRARDRLYIYGYQGKNAPDAACWHAMIAAAMDKIDGVTREPADEGGEVLRLTSAQRAVPKPDARTFTGDVSVTLPDFARTIPVPEPAPARWLAPSALTAEGENDEPPARSPLAGMALDRQRFLRGRLIHRLLETLPDLQPSAREGAARRFIAHPMHGLDAAAQDDIVSAALRIVNEGTLAALFAPTSRAEVPVVGMLKTRGGSVPVHGIVDRLAVEEGRVLIVDFKTNRPPPRDLGAVPRLYVRQMAVYREILRRIYPGLAVVCALLWTEGPDLMTLDDAALDDALAPIAAS